MCGAISYTYINVDRYFLTIVDDFTCTTWVYLLQPKLDVFSMIRNFLNLVRNQFLGAVKILRIDNVTEFFQRECHELLDYGIIKAHVLIDNN